MKDLEVGPASPRAHPGEAAGRAAFEAAWREYLPKRIEADFPAWRDQRDWTARKYAMWKRGEKMPSQMPSSLVRCVYSETHRLEPT